MAITAGIDIGSATTKAVILSNHEILDYTIRLTGAKPVLAAKSCMEKALKNANCSLSDINYSVSTGYGRRTVNFVNGTINEIHANARGAIWLGSTMGTVRTIIDIGGQDTKVISMNDYGNIEDFAMNDKCAAGTGRFLEVMCGVLGIEINELGKLSLKADEIIDINSTCTVFAESEVISLIAREKRKEDIIAGLHRSIAQRVVKMANSVGIKEVVFFDGGGAKNIGLRKTIEKELGMKIYVPEKPQIVTAIGAALIAQDKIKK